MERIVVGIDGSDTSQAALAFAVDEARAHNAEVIAVHAWHVPYIGGFPLTAVVLDPTDYETAGRATVEKAVARVDQEGLPKPIGTHLVSGNPAWSLIEAAKDADLLVVGSRGLGGFRGLLLGSVSQQVVHHAPCPVVIIPAGED